MTKKCKKCGLEGDESLFVKREKMCVTCKREYQKNWRDNNKNYIKNYNEENAGYIQDLKKQHYENNKDYYVEKNKRWYEEHKEEKLQYNKQWVKENPEKVKTQRDRRKPKLKIYRENNKDKIKKYCEEYKPKRRRRVKERYENDINYKIAFLIGSRFRKAMRLYSQTGKIYSIKEYPIDIEAVVKHLGLPPQDGNKYHIDHIFPVSAFNHNDVNEIKMCWHPLNLRWLEMNENLVKSNNYNESEFLEYKNKFNKLVGK